MIKKRTISLSLMLVLILVLTGCTSNNSAEGTDELSLPQEEKKVIVETAEVKQGNLYSKRGISAQVVSTQEVEVYVNIGGRIIEMAVKEGDIVEKGQIIALLDSEEQEMVISQANDAVDQVKAQINQAKQQLQTAEHGKRQATSRHEQSKLAFARLEKQYSKFQNPQDKNEMETSHSIDLTELKSQWDNALSNFEKSSRLYDKDIIPRKELEQAQAQEESARRSYEKSLLSAKESAEKNMLAVNESSEELKNTIENDKIGLLISEMELQQAGVGIEQAKIILTQAQQASQQAKKESEKAKTKLSESAIRAPFTGIVNNVHIKEGGYAAPQAPIVTMFNDQQLKVVAAIYPSQKKDLVNGQKIEIVGVNGEVSHDGEITHIAPYIDDKGFIQLEASIPGDSKNFIVGEYVELVVETMIGKNQIIIPTKAITEKDDRTFIYSIQDSKASYQEIEILQMQEEWTSIKGNLQSGEEIAVKGMVLLSDGSNVQVVGEGNPAEEITKPTKEDKDSSTEKDGESQ